MYFRVLENGVRPPSSAKSKAFLLTDNWDDWFTYSTMYALRVYDAHPSPLIGFQPTLARA